MSERIIVYNAVMIGVLMVLAGCMLGTERRFKWVVPLLGGGVGGASSSSKGKDFGSGDITQGPPVVPRFAQHHIGAALCTSHPWIAAVVGSDVVANRFQSMSLVVLGQAAIAAVSLAALLIRHGDETQPIYPLATNATGEMGMTSTGVVVSVGVRGTGSEQGAHGAFLIIGIVAAGFALMLQLVGAALLDGSEGFERMRLAASKSSALSRQASKYKTYSGSGGNNDSGGAGKQLEDGGYSSGAVDIPSHVKRSVCERICTRVSRGPAPADGRHPAGPWFCCRASFMQTFASMCMLAAVLGTLIIGIQRAQDFGDAWGWCVLFGTLIWVFVLAPFAALIEGPILSTCSRDYAKSVRAQVEAALPGHPGLAPPPAPLPKMAAFEEKTGPVPVYSSSSPHSSSPALSQQHHEHLLDRVESLLDQSPNGSPTAAGGSPIRADGTFTDEANHQLMDRVDGMLTQLESRVLDPSIMDMKGTPAMGGAWGGMGASMAGSGNFAMSTGVAKYGATSPYERGISDGKGVAAEIALHANPSMSPSSFRPGTPKLEPLPDRGGVSKLPPLRGGMDHGGEAPLTPAQRRGPTVPLSGNRQTPPGVPLDEEGLTGTEMPGGLNVFDDGTGMPGGVGGFGFYSGGAMSPSNNDAMALAMMDPQMQQFEQMQQLQQLQQMQEMQQFQQMQMMQQAQQQQQQQMMQMNMMGGSGAGLPGFFAADDPPPPPPEEIPSPQHGAPPPPPPTP